MVGAARLVFIDETCTNTAMVRLRGRALRGERLVDYAPHGAWKMITFVGGLRQRGMTAPFVIEGAMNGPMFLAYIKQCLVPTLKRGDIVLMDNLPVHNVAGVEEAIAAAGARPPELRVALATGPPGSYVVLASKGRAGMKS